MSEREWFYVEGGVQRGPHTVEEIGEVVRRLGASTLVWRAGLEEWVPADTVEEVVRASRRWEGGMGPSTLNPLVLWRRCFDWSGRFSRSEFAVAHLGFSMLGVVVIGLPVGLAAVAGGDANTTVMVVVALLLLAWVPLAFAVSLGATIRRLHDLGQSGWLALVSFVPCVNLAFLLYLLAAQGQEGPAVPSSRPVPVAALVVVLAMLVLGAPVIIGIIAAIAIPSLLRARVAANEAAAIGNVRTVVTAQVAYQSANQGSYDGRWECLSLPQDCIPGYTGPSFIDAALFEGPRSGYLFELQGGGPPGTAGLSPSSTDAFVILAYPATAGQTGVRAFCGDGTGRVCAIAGGSKDDLIDRSSGPSGIRCANACRDLR